jgi:hypothetical protein
MLLRGQPSSYSTTQECLQQLLSRGAHFTGFGMNFDKKTVGINMKRFLQPLIADARVPAISCPRGADWMPCEVNVPMVREDLPLTVQHIDLAHTCAFFFKDVLVDLLEGVNSCQLLLTPLTMDGWLKSTVSVEPS